MVTSGLVLWAVAPALTSCSSAAQVSILPTTTAVGTAVGPSAGYPATGDNGFTARPLFFVRGGYVSIRLYDIGYGGSYLSSTVRSDTNIRIMAFSYEGVDALFLGSVRRNGYSLRWLVYCGTKAETKDYLLLLYTSTGRATCTRVL